MPTERRRTWFRLATAALASTVAIVLAVPALLGADEPECPCAFTAPAGWQTTTTGIRDGVPFRAFAMPLPEPSADARSHRPELVLSWGAVQGAACSADQGPREVADLFMASFEKRQARWRSFLTSEGLTAPTTWAPLGILVEPPTTFPAPARSAAARTKVFSPAGPSVTLYQWVAFADDGPLVELRFRANEAEFAALLPSVLTAAATLKPLTVPKGAR